jgi:outer membrane protein OmpA-like peptidoglycan-associated protein
LENAEMNKLAILAVAGAVLTSACTTDPFTGEQKASNTGVGAGVGAVLGGLGGALVSGGKTKGALIGAGVGALAGGAIGAYQDNQEAALRERLRNTGVSVTRVGDDIVLNMPSNITFDRDRSVVRREFYDVLQSVSLVLKEFDRSLVTVEGHTDGDGSDAYNLELSQDRARAVADFLSDQGVDPRRLSTEGYGEVRPIATNATAQGKALNRRVEIRIVPLTA